MVVTRKWGGSRKGEMLVKEYKLLVIRFINSGVLMHSTVTIINNSVNYILKSYYERDFKCSHHTKRHGNYVK